MKLQHITFTGIDAKTDIKALTEIQREFPIAEFGVLTSYHWNENGNRYLDPRLLRNFRTRDGRIGETDINLSLHICGRAAHDAAYGDWWEIDHLEVRFVRGMFAFLWNGDLDDEFPATLPPTNGPR